MFSSRQRKLPQSLVKICQLTERDLFEFERLVPIFRQDGTHVASTE